MVAVAIRDLPKVNNSHVNYIGWQEVPIDRGGRGVLSEYTVSICHLSNSIKPSFKTGFIIPFYGSAVSHVSCYQFVSVPDALRWTPC